MISEIPLKDTNTFFRIFWLNQLTGKFRVQYVPDNMEFGCKGWATLFLRKFRRECAAIYADQKKLYLQVGLHLWCLNNSDIILERNRINDIFASFIVLDNGKIVFENKYLCISDNEEQDFFLWVSKIPRDKEHLSNLSKWEDGIRTTEEDLLKLIKSTESALKQKETVDSFYLKILLPFSNFAMKRNLKKLYNDFNKNRKTTGTGPDS